MLCNFGYARGRCAHFPVLANDAVRFSIRSSTNGLIHLIWIAEREHAPASHGSVQYSQGAFDPAVPQELAALAQAFVRTFLKGNCPQGVDK